jgi:glycosyltransferase involved in cell wall biosynthesis
VRYDSDVRLLFLSGTPTGGSAVGTRQLAQRLAGRGHQVGLLVQQRSRPRAGLVASPRPRWVTAVAAMPARVGRALRRAATTRPNWCGSSGGVVECTSVAPEQVLPSVCEAFHPDVVVVSSVHRRAWTAVHSWLSRAGLPVALYIREVATFENIPIAELSPDVTVTNSETYRERVVALGLLAVTIPSLIEIDQYHVDSTREVVLFVNPLPSRGLAIAMALASDRPDLRFAFQQSWPLRKRDDRALGRWIRRQPKIELRPYESDGARAYRDARVLLLPYQVDQRPRVVMEAQGNGIPVLAADLPAHREAVGPGGLFVPPDAPTAAWATALSALWDDRSTYERLSAAARTHARRDDQDPARIVERFEALMEQTRSARSSR